MTRWLMVSVLVLGALGGSAWSRGSATAQAFETATVTAGIPPVIEHDAVSARSEAEHSARLDADRDAHRREVALARARREAPFDLTWGIER